MKSFTRRFAVPVGLALAFAVSAGANEVYRWVDENGVVHFGDRPDSERAERVSVRTGQPSSTADATSTTTAEEESDEASQELFAAPAEDELQAARQANCELATERHQRMRDAPRLYREGPEGERLYLDDDAVAAALEQARTEVATWCD